jgi:hypothetical protein
MNTNEKQALKPGFHHLTISPPHHLAISPPHHLTTSLFRKVVDKSCLRIVLVMNKYERKANAL